MLLLGLVIAVAVVDALNPSTVLPALLYALGRHARRDVAAFTAGVFVVSTLGGLVLVFGPGRALLHVVSHPSHRTVRLIEAAVGVLLIVIAAILWRTRARVARSLAQDRRKAGNSAFLIGAGIMAAELPTALPYFGALIAVTEGAHSALASLGYVLLYNVVFVAPLLVLLAVIVISGERGAKLAARVRGPLIRYAPTLFPLLLGTLGVVLLVVSLVS